MQKRNNEKNQLNAKIAQLKGSYEEARAVEAQRNKEISRLEQSNSSFMGKVNELKLKLDVERRSMEDMRLEFESKYSLVMHEKSTLESEVEE